MMLRISALMLAAAVLSAPQLVRLDARAPIPYFVEDGTGVPGYVNSDRDLAKLAFSAWSRESDGRVKFTEAQSPARAQIRLRWISPTEGLYGETQPVQMNGKPGAVVYVMPQVSVQGEPLAGRAVQDSLLRDTVVYLTCVHELGHAVGLQHTRRFEDIMYFFGYGGDILNFFMRYRQKLHSRADIAKYSGLSVNDVNELRRLYAN